jgi:hypothetical protein
VRLTTTLDHPVGPNPAARVWGNAARNPTCLAQNPGGGLLVTDLSVRGRAGGPTCTRTAHGSFRAISGGWIAEGLWDLTGFPTETISFTDRFFDSEMTWARLLSFRRQVHPRPHPHLTLPAPNHAQLPPGGVQGWRACPHAQPGFPTRGAPPAAARRLHLLTSSPTNPPRYVTDRKRHAGL